MCDLGMDILRLDREAGPNDTVRCDLTEPAGYRHLFDGVQCVLHLAAAKGDWGISAEEYHRDNVEATEALLSAGREAGITKWIFYSTVSVLGPSDVPLSEDAAPNPVNSYGSTKLACEEMFHQFAADDEAAEVLIIRPSAVYGPGNPWNTNIYRLIEAIYRRRFVMVGDGAVCKTTSYIENLVDATLFLLERMRPGVQIYHYVDEPVMTMDDMVETIYALLQRRRPRFRVPLPVASGLARLADTIADWTKTDLPITSARIRKFCTGTVFSASRIRDAGFEQPVSNTDALKRTVDWYVELPEH